MENSHAQQTAVTIQTASRLFDTSEAELRAMIKSGKLTARKVGRRFYFDPKILKQLFIGEVE